MGDQDLISRLLMEAQVHAQEARAQRATVHQIYQHVTGKTGEPGDWNGAAPVIAEIDRLRAVNAELVEALRGLLDELTALMGSSEGVAGLHLNGDIAPWSDLSPGGAYEHLGQINAAYDALAKAEGQS